MKNLNFERLLFTTLVYLVGESIDKGIETIVGLKRTHVQISDQINDSDGTRDKHDKLLRVVIVIDHLEESLHDAALDERIAARVVRGQMIQEREQTRGELVRERLFCLVDQVLDTFAHERGQ